VTVSGSLERLRASPRPRVLFVAHAFGGGVGRHIASLARSIEADAEVLLLQPHLESFAALRWLRGGEELALWFHAAEEWDRAMELLDSIGIDRVHYHHVHGLPQAVLGLPRRLRCAHEVTLHDYFPACPAYHLTGAAGRYCGGDPDCRHCVDAAPAQWGLSIDAWRAAFGELLAGARRVIAPSDDAAQRIRRFFPAISPVAWPHPEDDGAAAIAPARVLVPGALSPAKGLEILDACVRDAARRRLPLHFRALGYLASPIPHWPEMPFSLTGEYREGDLPALIAIEHGDAFFFPAQCPETFSYTLSAALATDLPIVATDLGALPERLAGRPNSRVVRWDASPASMNDALLSLVRAPAAPPGAAGPRMDAAKYRALYLEGLVRSPGAIPAPAPVDPRWLEPPAGSPTLSPLAWLYDDAVRCGRERSREELRRRAGEADAELASAAVERARARAALEECRTALSLREAELREARERAADALGLRERLERMESSRSWRITAPLRAIGRWWRRLA